MNLIWYGLWFIVAVSLLVTVHEYGHYWVARRLGFKVLRFSVGFGKPLWRRKLGHDETELVIAPIPMGGYVKMLDEREGAVEARMQIDAGALTSDGVLKLSSGKKKHVLVKPA